MVTFNYQRKKQRIMNDKGRPHYRFGRASWM
jgi:hypothetical protein